MKKEMFVKITLIIMAWVTMADCVVTPISVNIMEAFPNMTDFQLNFILSGAMLVAVPSALVFGKLAQYIRKRSLIVFSYTIYVLFGLIPLFFNSVEVLMLSRVAAGIANGCMGACAFSLIAELFEEESVSSALMGFYNAFGSFAGVVISAAVGFLALADWRYAFIMNAFGLIPLLFAIFALPKGEPEGRKASSGVSLHVPAVVWRYAVFMFLFCALCMPAFYFVAVYVDETGLGNSSVAGLMSSVLTIGGFLAGLVFGAVYQRARHTTEAGSFFATAAGMALLFITHNVIVAGVLILVVGFTYILAMTYYFRVAVAAAPPEKAAFASSMIHAAMGLGCFCCTYVVLFFQRAVSLPTMSSVFLACGICLLVFGVIAVLFIVHETRVVQNR